MDNWYKEPAYNGGGIVKKGNILKEPLTAQQPVEGPIAPVLNAPAKGDKVEDAEDYNLLAQEFITGRKNSQKHPQAYNRLMINIERLDPKTRRLVEGIRNKINSTKPLENMAKFDPAIKDTFDTYHEGAMQNKYGREKQMPMKSLRKSDPKLYLDNVIASIDQVLGKLDKTHKKAAEGTDTVNGISDTTVQSFDAWSAGTPNKQGKPINGTKKKKSKK
jgi:hypothetical protein